MFKGDKVNTEVNNKESHYIEEKYNPVTEKDLISLDQLISSSKTICIALNSSSQEYQYSVLRYKIDESDKSIYFELERKGDRYSIYLGSIVGIELSKSKILIYMENKCNKQIKDAWVFYLNIDEGIYNENIKSNKISENLDLERNHTYKKYENIDPLKYHVERYKFMNKGLCLEEKNYVDKRREKYIFLNELDNDLHGEITIFNTKGKIGRLVYQIQSKTLKILDILPEIYNKGLGSFGLEIIEDVAIKNDVNKIVGVLSPGDITDHEERLYRFYRKNKYIIYRNGDVEKIEKILA